MNRIQYKHIERREGIMKTVFLLLLLLSTGGCAAKMSLSDLRHFAEGFRRAQEDEMRRCWVARCCWTSYYGSCPQHGPRSGYGTLRHPCY